jgi:hypothetical protein
VSSLSDIAGSRRRRTAVRMSSCHRRTASRRLPCQLTRPRAARVTSRRASASRPTCRMWTATSSRSPGCRRSSRARCSPATRATAVRSRICSSTSSPTTRRRGSGRACGGLYQRVFNEYGDDSVAQLGGAHVALENVSNLATKRIEWGRLAAYLEQSTRYIAYDDPPGAATATTATSTSWPAPRRAYERELDAIFDLYAGLVPEVLDWVRRRWPRDDGHLRRSSTATPPRPRPSICCAGCCRPRRRPTSGCSPPGSPTSSCCCGCAPTSCRVAPARRRLLRELRTVIPSFLTRVDRPDRGGAWSGLPGRHPPRDPRAGRPIR